MDAFETPQKSIDWALKCLENGARASKWYLDNKAFTHVVEEDLVGTRTAKLKMVSNPSPEIEGNFTNAFVSIKHSFDQSLFAAAQVVGCHRFDKPYPWADSYVGLKGIIDKRQRKPDTTLPDILIDEIWRQEPYATRPGFSGGNDLVREIAKVSNDKHTIGFTVGAKVVSMTIPPGSFLRSDTIGARASFDFSWDSIKKELIISVATKGASAVYDNAAISCDIFLERAGDIGKIPVFILITDFAKKAQVVLDGFKAVCT